MVCRVSLDVMRQCSVAYRILSADDLEGVLVNIAKRLDELEWPESQVGDVHPTLLQDIKLTSFYR